MATYLVDACLSKLELFAGKGSKNSEIFLIGPNSIKIGSKLKLGWKTSKWRLKGHSRDWRALEGVLRARPRVTSCTIAGQWPVRFGSVRMVRTQANLVARAWCASPARGRHVSLVGPAALLRMPADAWRRCLLSPPVFFRIFQKREFWRFQSIFFRFLYLPIHNPNHQVLFTNIVDLIFYFYNIFFLYFFGNHRSYYLSLNLEKNTSSYRKLRFLETPIFVKKPQETCVNLILVTYLKNSRSNGQETPQI